MRSFQSSQVHVLSFFPLLFLYSLGSSSSSSSSSVLLRGLRVLSARKPNWWRWQHDGPIESTRHSFVWACPVRAWPRGRHSHHQGRFSGRARARISNNYIYIADTFYSLQIILSNKQHQFVPSIENRWTRLFCSSTT